MVAIRPLLVFSMVAGIAAAGKCKPSSPTSLTALATETTVSESSVETTSASTTGTLASETSTGSTIEIATSSTTDATSSTVSETSTASTTEISATETTTSSTTESLVDTTTDTTLTTFMTSLSSTETTTEPATTTSEAAVVVTCPADPPQCLGTMEIKCNYAVFGISPDSISTLDDCAHKCDRSSSCTVFVFNQSTSRCYLSFNHNDANGGQSWSGWVSGTKGTCG
ncbi:hypothetical protein FALBO_15759 [Fusarium albosuccineum]|uniref:Apple domain-containing protein n=1 Tax=Fusarium albosuccineum TaxID=1237068 RepID=A0A8H4KRD7_9HYPO|nr:hypothetical protein FALBO_15759 [Fusarium albosuccineum]